MYSLPNLTRRTLLGATAVATVAAVAATNEVAWAEGGAVEPGEGVLVAGGVARAVVVPPPDLPPSSIDPILVELEQGTITSPMRVVQDPDAAGEGYVDAPFGQNMAGSVTVSFDVSAKAEYRMSVRVWTLNDSADSVFVKIDDGESFTWHLGTQHGHWRWKTLGNSSGSPQTFALAPGRHTLTISGREAGVRLDQAKLESDVVVTQTAHAIDVLVEYVRRSTGVALPVRTVDSLSDDTLPSGRIYVGWTGPDSTGRVAESLSGLDADGYVLDVDGAAVVIVGSSEWGTRYGVYEVLERFVGVRWLLPGADGEDVPARSTIRLPRGTIREEPSFLSRTLPYLFDTNEPNARDWASSDPQVQWATRQRTHSRITRIGNHNLFNIFPTGVYADPAKPTYRPEIYPIINGQLTVPRVGDVSTWQPRFDIPETVDIAVGWVIDFFTANPDEPLVSLGMNDGHGFSDGDREPGMINSLGVVSASESYYRWVNAVVAEVIHRRPDLATKTFPVLAYWEVADPPTFTLHPNVVPMITKEAHVWSDPVGRAGYQGLFDRWEGKAGQLALYDYASGARFLAPRIYSRDLQEAYAYAYQRGMRHSYCDMAPNVVGEGPKTWVYAKMMWNVDADVDALTREWCERVVGRRAAAPLRRYFQMWEKFWAGVAQQTPFWEYSRNRTYVAFILTDYLAQVSDSDASDARRLLERALALVETDAQRRRAKLIIEAFSYYEAGYLSFPRPLARPRSTAQARSIAASIRDELPQRVAQARRRLTIEHAHQEDPVLQHRTDHRRYQHTWTGFNGSQFWNLVDYLRESEPAGGRVTNDLEHIREAGPSDAPSARFARFVLRASRGELAQLAPNGSFELGDSDAPGWRFIGNVSRVEGQGYDGGAALRLAPDVEIPGTGQEHSVVQAIPITPGLCAYRARFRASSAEVAEGQLSVKIHLWTPEGANIYAYHQPMQLLRPTGTGWTWVGLCEDIPAEASGKPVGQLRLVASLLGFHGEGVVHLDDVQVLSEGSM